MADTAVDDTVLVTDSARNTTITSLLNNSSGVFTPDPEDLVAVADIGVLVRDTAPVIVDLGSATESKSAHVDNVAMVTGLATGVIIGPAVPDGVNSRFVRVHKVEVPAKPRDVPNTLTAIPANVLGTTKEKEN